jgi:hypothetical protein
MDWGLGTYEHIAAQLLPVARVVVDRAAPAEGDRMLAIYDAAPLGARRLAEPSYVPPSK